MCLAQGPQRSDADEARTRDPAVSSQALYHWATALPSLTYDGTGIYKFELERASIKSSGRAKTKLYMSS